MRKNKFRYNRDNITSRLFAQNKKRRPSHYDEDEDEEEHHRGGGMSTAGALGVGATGLALANQGLSAMGTIQGVKEQAGGIKGWWDRRKRRKADYKKFGGDEHLMEKKRDQAFRLSKNAKNSAQEAALRHRESEIADSLNYARKKNAYKADMAKQTTMLGKGTTWAKHNPWKAGAAVAGGAALAGGAYYLWKKRQEKKRREKERREIEAQTRHQSRQFAGAMGSTLTRGLNKGLRKFPRRTGLKKFPSVGGGLNHSLSPVKSRWSINKKASIPFKSSTTSTANIFPGSKAKAKSIANLGSSSSNKPKVSPEVRKAKFQELQNIKKEARAKTARKNELTARREAKQNDQARRDLAQKKVHERQINHKEQNVRDLAAKTDLQRTAGAGVMGHEYKQARKELRDARIDLHNTKYKDNKMGGLMARGLGFKKFDKNGNLRWGKKRLAAGALGAYAAYKMLKDDDEK